MPLQRKISNSFLNFLIIKDDIRYKQGVLIKITILPSETCPSKRKDPLILFENVASSEIVSQ